MLLPRRDQNRFSGQGWRTSDSTLPKLCLGADFGGFRRGFAFSCEVVFPPLPVTVGCGPSGATWARLRDGQAALLRIRTE